MEWRSSSTSTVSIKGRISRARSSSRGAARASEHGRIPEAVHIFVNEAGSGGLARVESGEGGQVDETECDPAARRPEILTQEPVEDDGAGEFVPVRQSR